MNPRTTSLRLRAELATGPKTTDHLIQVLGVTRQRVHRLIFNEGSNIVRFDLTPVTGKYCRAEYGFRPSLTGSSRVA